MKTKQSNKKAALDFFRMIIARNINEAYEKYVDMKGKHHNQFFSKGFPALKAAMIENHAKFPKTKMVVKHVLEDGDFVATHSHVVHIPGQAGVMVFHLVRFKNGKIVEMWDCGQPIPADSPNKDGPF